MRRPGGCRAILEDRSPHVVTVGAFDRLPSQAVLLAKRTPIAVVGCELIGGGCQLPSVSFDGAI